MMVRHTGNVRRNARGGALLPRVIYNRKHSQGRTPKRGPFCMPKLKRAPTERAEIVFHRPVTQLEPGLLFLCSKSACSLSDRPIEGYSHYRSERRGNGALRVLTTPQYVESIVQPSLKAPVASDRYQCPKIWRFSAERLLPITGLSSTPCRACV